MVSFRYDCDIQYVRVGAIFRQRKTRRRKWRTGASLTGGTSILSSQAAFGLPLQPGDC